MRPDPAFWAGRTVCVTGGTGFLGFHLVRLLGEVGARVRVFGLATPADHPIRRFADAEIIAGDVLDRDTVQSAVAGCSIVIHAAGIVAVWGRAVEKMWPVHVDGTRHVLEALDRDARVVHTSSVVAVGASRHREILNEDSPFNLGHVKIAYVQAKRAAEELALGSRRDVVVVNPGYLLGPDDFEKSVMGKLCHRFWRGRAPLAPPGGLNLVDVRDVALGHLLAAERGTSGRRYILGCENLTYPEFLGQMADVAGFRPRWLPRIPRSVFWLAGLVNEVRGRLKGKEPYPSLAHARLNRYYWFHSSDRARAELGYSPRSVRKSLADAYAWYASREAFHLRGFNRWLLRPSA
ncbi:MAG TPA: NAD-dependent epimerase/dehydratase family protein [Gemmataceae bacterium]|jgi:dihydroflavonol-4-reductase|nr:NAD-dependent epimerase/dehydratase family protein [Gemmataceae bacterium]